jgi:DNA-directed RNA polymerase subunit RPC12/RpoP
MSDSRTCPHCGCDRLFGPAQWLGPGDLVTTYYDCARCHSIVVEEDGVLVARAGAW